MPGCDWATNCLLTTELELTREDVSVTASKVASCNESAAIPCWFVWFIVSVLAIALPSSPAVQLVRPLRSIERG